MSNEQKLREALQAYIDAGFGNSTDPHKQGAAYDLAIEALALPTAEQVGDINVAESFTSVTKTAPPVGERADFDGWFADRYPNTEDRQSEFRMTSVRDLMFEAWNIAFGQGCVHGEGQARAALSAGDAVDAHRYRWLMHNCTLGIKQNGVGWILNTSACVAPDCIKDVGAAIDAAMRKGQP